VTERSVAVIGGGPMGLACAYELLKQGREVTLYDAGPRLGGMSVAFDFGGLIIDRHFHFICKTDFEYFRVLDELNLSHTLKWRRTRMGMYHERELLEWGSPVSLLKFPGLSWATKIRYGFNVLSVKRRNRFDDLDERNARAWLRDRIGERGYKVLWEPLLAGKFHHHQGSVSAAWVAARIQRLGRSRDLLMREQLGYLEGGSDTLIQGLDARIRELGGRVRLNAPVERIDGGRARDGCAH